MATYNETQTTLSDSEIRTQRRIVDAIPTIIRDPRNSTRLIINLVESVSRGEVRVADPTSPFALMAEMTAQLAAQTVNENDILHRRQYSSAAVDMNDIYYHLSDYEMFGLYATPANATIIILLKVDTIRARAVPDANNPNIKKIVIPKHSEFTIADYTFTMQYPVVITALPHGAVNYQYDTSEISPIYPSQSYPMTAKVTVKNGEEWVGIVIPVKQMRIDKQIINVNSAAGVKKSLSFSDKFCYLRAYQKATNSNVWTPISVFMNKQIYDPRTPAITAKVLTNAVEVEIPQIYFTNGLIKDSIRVDVYTTKGKLDIDLSTYEVGSFSATWVDHDTTDESIYSSVLYDFDGISIASKAEVSGGSEPLSFGDVRKRIVSRGQSDYGYAITPTQVENLLNVNGFDLVANIDNITDRQYLATRLLPEPETRTLDETLGGTNKQDQAARAQLTVTGIGADVRLLQASVSELTLNRHVFDNGRRLTITPRVLYRTDNGILRVVDPAQVDAILNTGLTSPEVVSNIVNNTNYMYTPFYTVMDIKPDEFSTRCYNLDTPEITSTYITRSNLTSLISVELTGYEIIVKAGQGYQLLVRLEGDNVWKKLGADRTSVQLTIADGNNRVWWNGVLLSPVDIEGMIQGPAIFSFDIDTTYDIDELDRIILSGQRVPVALDAAFSLLVMVKDHLPDGYITTDIDNLIQPSYLPNYDSAAAYLGILNETIEITLGSALKSLWTSSRSVVDPNIYERYSEVVYAKWTSDIYKRNDDGTLVIDIDPETELPVALIEHAKGTPILDEYNQPTILHNVGDVIIDPVNGKPKVKGGEDAILRHMDMVLFDGKYYFATDPLTQLYLESVVKKVVNWTTIDIPRIQKQLIDRSKLYFQPKTTTGTMEVIIDENETVVVRADQDLRITYYVTKESYDNPELRRYITDATPRVVKDALSKRTVSLDGIVEDIRAAMGDDILSVTVDGFVENKWQIITLTNESMLPAIGKRLVTLPSKELRVEDAITVDILKHVDRVI